MLCQWIIKYPNVIIVIDFDLPPEDRIGVRIRGAFQLEQTINQNTSYLRMYFQLIESNSHNTTHSWQTVSYQVN